MTTRAEPAGGSRGPGKPSHAAPPPVGVLVLWLAVCSLATPAAAATLEADQSESREGYFQLRWEADEPVRLIEATSPDFRDARELYSGSDSARVISGKPDGIWYYRLESAASDAEILSEPVTVTVRHHSLRRAFAFFVLGAVVFAATLALIFVARPGADERGQ